MTRRYMVVLQSAKFYATNMQNAKMVLRIGTKDHI